MTSNKLFFIGLAVVAVLYFVAAGSNARHGDEDQADYKSEEQQTALVNKYKGSGLETMADRFDPFVAKIDIFNAIDKDVSARQDCPVVGTGKKRVIRLTKEDDSCRIFLSPSDESYRKTTLAFDFDEPGIATRGDTLKPLGAERVLAQRFTLILPHFVIATAEELDVTFIANEKPSKVYSKRIKPNASIKIPVWKKGGQLTLTCVSCNNRPIYIRAE